MQENDYTFVTLDTTEESPLLEDVVVVDVDGEDGLLDAVMLDDSQATTDFITLSDDTVMMPDSDSMDDLSIDVDGIDVSFIL